MVVFAESYMSMLHISSHRPLYADGFKLLNGVIPFVLALGFGQTWNTYYYHHVKHHHVEDNGRNDLSSTLAYQRDSLPSVSAWSSLIYVFSLNIFHGLLPVFVLFWAFLPCNTSGASSLFFPKGAGRFWL